MKTLRSDCEGRSGSLRILRALLWTSFSRGRRWCDDMKLDVAGTWGKKQEKIAISGSTLGSNGKHFLGATRSMWDEML